MPTQQPTQQPTIFVVEIGATPTKKRGPKPPLKYALKSPYHGG
jgi:hypothetical protein